MIKKRVPVKDRISPTEHIANTLNPKLESIHIKVSGYAPRHVSSYRGTDSVKIDEKAAEDYLTETGGNHHTYLHTHPDNISSGSEEYLSRRPSDPEYRQPQTNASFGDWAEFLSKKRRKYEAITQMDSETGEISGYVYYKKKNNPNPAQIKERRKVINYVLESKRLDKKILRLKGKTCNAKEQEELRIAEAERSRLDNFFQNQSNRDVFAASWREPGGKSKRLEAAEMLSEQYGLIYRFVPVSIDHPVNVRLRKSLVEKVEVTTAIIGITGLAISLFFLSSNITGNVIGNLTNSTSNYIGVIFLLLGIVGSFFYFRNRGQ